MALILSISSLIKRKLSKKVLLNCFGSGFTSMFRIDAMKRNEENL